MLFFLNFAAACQTYPWDPIGSVPVEEEGPDGGLEEPSDSADELEPDAGVDEELVDAGVDEELADAGAADDGAADAGETLAPPLDASIPEPDSDVLAPDCGVGTPPSLSLGLPELGRRTIFSSDDIAPRRLVLTHDGDEVSCSRNGGDFGPCGESDALVWNADDYEQSHTIRVTAAGAPPREMEFTPSAFLPDLEFVDCTDEVTSNESAATFNTRLGTAFRVICLSDGVRVSGPTILGADNITILARLDEVAFFTATSADAIDLNSHSGIDLVAVNALTTGGTLHAALRISPASGDIRLHDSELRCEANNCYVMYVRGSIEARRSLFLGGTETSSYSYGVYGYGFSARLLMVDSEVRSRANILYCAVGARFKVRNSDLRSDYPSASTHTGAVTVYNNNAQLELTDSTLRTTGLPALLVGGGLPTYTTLDGNSIRKVSGTSSGEHDVITSLSDYPVLYSSSPNVFCNEGSTTSDGAFRANLVTGSYNTQSSSFQSNLQDGVGDCVSFD